MAPFTPFIQQFREVQPKYSRLYTRLLAKAGLTQPQYAVLLELVQATPVPLLMSPVRCNLHHTQPAGTTLVDRLEKNNFLKRLQHPRDRRVWLLQILPRGKKIVGQIQTRFLNLMVKTATQFSASERSTVQRFYSNLSKNLDAVLMGPPGRRR